MNETNTSYRSIVKRALSGHASLGLLGGALLYLIAITGSMIVVHDRWQRWEEPEIAETAVLSPDAAQASIPRALELEAGAPQTAHLYIRMPTEDLPRAVLTTDNKAWYVDGDGEIVGREAHSWTEFVMALHINLTLPIVWGMILVGALGVVLAALAITGVVAHPKIFKDAFRLRSRHDPQLARADWHNRLGVWTLPFTIAVAMTGAYIGLSYAGAGVLGTAYEKGDIEPVYATIFGDEPEIDPTPAPLPNIARALEVVQTRFPETFPTYIVVHDPMTRGQFVQIIAEHPQRLVYGEVYSFDGDGTYLGKVGIADGEIGRQAAASTYKLHFGDYGGIPVELAYILFGFALAAVTATGTTLWLRKRRRKGLPTERMEAMWSVVVWGIPLDLVAMAWLRAAGGPDAPLVLCFWAMLAGGLALAAARPALFSRDQLRPLLGIALAGTAIAHSIAYLPQASGTWAINAGMLLVAAVAMAPSARAFAARLRKQPSGAGDGNPPYTRNLSHGHDLEKGIVPREAIE